MSVKSLQKKITDAVKEIEEESKLQLLLDLANMFNGEEGEEEEEEEGEEEEEEEEGE